MNKYLDLEHYNNSNNERPAILKYSGNNLLNGQSFIWPYKFKINSNNYPLYVPTIINEFIPYKVGVTAAILDNPRDYYITDWAITLKYKNEEAKSTPILWERSGMKQVLTSNLIGNKYFWINNSDEICQMINGALSRVTGNDSLLIVKNAERWQLLVHTKIIDKIESFHFNDKMVPFFGFDYEENNGIKIVKLQTHTIIDEIYYTITTPLSTNKMFPFDKVIFKSEQLNVPTLSLQSYDNATKNNSIATILSYDLTVSDISTVGTSMTYVSTNKDRSLSLQDDTLPGNFTITPYFVTKSGEEFLLQLKPDEKISFSLMFY